MCDNPNPLAIKIHDAAVWEDIEFVPSVCRRLYITGHEYKKMFAKNEQVVEKLGEEIGQNWVLKETPLYFD